MKTIIAGTRNITDAFLVRKAIEESEFEITEIVSGGARGVDSLGELYARRNRIPVKVFPARWDLYGRAAGIKRNEKMAEYADALIAIWDEKSKGTLDMIRRANAKNMKVYVKIVKEN